MPIKMKEWKTTLRIFHNVFLIILFSLFVTGCSFSSNHPEIDNQIQTVPNVSSKEDIHIDVIADAHNAIHLVWQSKERGLQYQTSRDNGSNWRQPITIDHEVSFGSSTEGPRIFNYKDTLLIFW